MRTIILAAALACGVRAADKTNEVRLPSLTIGTNTYKNAVVKRRNAAEAVFRYDGGIGKVKILDLPEPLRSKWADTNAAAALEKDREEEIKEGEEAVKTAESRRRAAAIRANFRKIDGRLVPKRLFVGVTGRVKQNVNGGLLLMEPRYNQVPTGRRFGTPGAFGGRAEYRAVEVVGEGAYRFVRNAGSKPTGEYVIVKALRMDRTISVGGVTAELYDCGEIPEIPNANQP